MKSDVGKSSVDPADAAAGDRVLAHADAEIEILIRAAQALRGRGDRARIPLEQVERELARVMHIELASILARAHELAASRVVSDADVTALQCEARESISVARACGVRVPRVLLRLVAGNLSTWPSAVRLQRWSRLLDPDVDAGPAPLDAHLP